MELNDYQQLAALTKVEPPSPEAARMIALLGLAGEAGSVLSEFKKNLRDGDAYQLFRENLMEELGDILWYLADVATLSDLTLEDIAQYNLRKTHQTYRHDRTGQATLFELHERFFDESFPLEQQLPRKATFSFREIGDPKDPTVVVVMDGHIQFGKPIKDNTFFPDYYRYHDVFHMTYATLLNWSPTTRFNLNKKRRFPEQVDDNEVGGRAIVTEEAVSAIVFQYSRGYSQFRDLRQVPHELLRVIKAITQPFEVRRCSTGEWQHAILEAFRIWHSMIENHGGIMRCDAIARKVEYEKEVKS